MLLVLVLVLLLVLLLVVVLLLLVVVVCAFFAHSSPYQKQLLPRLHSISVTSSAQASMLLSIWH